MRSIIALGFAAVAMFSISEAANFYQNVIVTSDLKVGGTSAPDASALVDMESTTQGMLPPRMTTAQRDAIGSPATGLQIYNTDTNQTEVYNGTLWAAQGGAGGGSGIGFLSGDAFNIDSTVGPWVAYLDPSPGSSPTTATGAGATVTCLRTTSAGEVIRGDGSLEITKDAANRQGEGCSVPVDIEGYASKRLVVRFTYDAPDADFDFGSGTAADPSDISVWWIQDDDNSVGRVVKAPINHLLDGSGNGWALVKTHPSESDHRLALHIGTTNSLEWNFITDDHLVEVGSASTVVPVTDWVDFTPTGTWTTNTTYSGKWRQVGDSMEGQVQVNLSGTPNTAVLSFNLPNGNKFDRDKMEVDAGIEAINLGTTIIEDSGTGQLVGGVVPLAGSDTALRPTFWSEQNETTNDLRMFQMDENDPIAWASTDTITVTFSVPIVGWQSNVTVNTGIDATIPPTLRASGDPPSATAGNPIIFPTADYDSHGNYDTGTGLYTAVTSGVYALGGYMASAAAAGIEVRAYVAGSNDASLGATDSNGEVTYFGTVSANAGQTISVRPSGTLDGNSASKLSIYRVDAVGAGLHVNENRYLQKFLTSDATVAGTLTDLTVTGLTVGRVYRIGGKIWHSENGTNVTALRTRVDMDNGATEVGRSQVTHDENVSGVDNSNVTDHLNVIFRATDTSLTFDFQITGAGRLFGDGTTAGTYITVEELPNYRKVDDF